MRKITRPDVRNTNPEYWEDVLKSHNLGLRQTGLHDENTENEEEVSIEEIE